MNAIFGRNCRCSNIITDFVTRYSSLTQRYDDDISDHIDLAWEHFMKEIKLVGDKTNCMKIKHGFPLNATFPTATETLVVSRLSQSLQFDSNVTRYSSEVISTAKQSLFRNIKWKLWLHEPTPVPTSPKCEAGKNTFEKLNDKFTEMSLFAQDNAIINIEKDCFPDLERKYLQWFGKNPVTEINECTSFLYGFQDREGHCRGNLYS